MLLYTVETVLYISFMALDAMGAGNTRLLKYAAVALLALSVQRSREPLVRAALLFTAAADVFLLLLDRYYAAGVACFIAVQALYTARLTKERKRLYTARSAAAENTAPSSLSRRAALSRLLPAGIGALAAAPYGLTALLAVFYILWFAVNLADALLLSLQTRRAAAPRAQQWTLFAVGLLLYFLCDLCVGLCNTQAPHMPWYRFFALGMWGFYLPGQALIHASAFTNGK